VHARALDSRVPSHFASDEEMFSIRQKVDCILWLAELKSYTCIQCNFNQVYLNQRALIYRSVMHWDKCLKETGSDLQQHGLSYHMVSQDNVELTSEALQRSP